MSETSEKIHNSTFRVKNLSLDRNFYSPLLQFSGAPIRPVLLPAFSVGTFMPIRPGIL